MKTTLRIRSVESRLEVAFVVSNAPECLFLQDRIHLRIFEGLGDARLTERRWDGQDLLLVCLVDAHFVEGLVRLGTARPDYLNDYELPQQEWR